LESEVVKRLDVRAVLHSVAEPVVAIDISILGLQLVSKLIKDSSWHSDVGVSGQESSIPGTVASREEGGVAIPGSRHACLHAIGSNSHVEPLSLVGVVAIKLT